MTPNSKLRSVNTKFWDDKYVIDLDPIEKLLFLYFLTNPLTTLAGVYEISLRRIAFDTGIDKDMVLKILDRFERDKKIYYRESFIILVNYRKNQKFNPKMEINVKNVIDSLPPSVAEHYNKVVNLDKNPPSIGYDSLSIGVDKVKVKVKVKEENEVESESEDVTSQTSPDFEKSSFSNFTYSQIKPQDFTDEAGVRAAIKKIIAEIKLTDFNKSNETTLTKLLMNPGQPLKPDMAFYILYQFALEFPSQTIERRNARYFVSVVDKRVKAKVSKLREESLKENLEKEKPPKPKTTLWPKANAEDGIKKSLVDIAIQSMSENT